MASSRGERCEQLGVVGQWWNLRLKSGARGQSTVTISIILISGFLNGSQDSLILDSHESIPRIKLVPGMMNVPPKRSVVTRITASA